MGRQGRVRTNDLFNRRFAHAAKDYSMRQTPEQVNDLVLAAGEIFACGIKRVPQYRGTRSSRNFQNVSESSAPLRFDVVTAVNVPINIRLSHVNKRKT